MIIGNAVSFDGAVALPEVRELVRGIRFDVFGFGVGERDGGEACAGGFGAVHGVASVGVVVGAVGLGEGAAAEDDEVDGAEHG